MNERRAGEWRHAEQDAFSGDGGFRSADAVAGLLATTIPLVVGAATGHPNAGLIAGLGGLNVALAMGAGRPVERLPWGLLTLGFGSLMTAVGTLLHPTAWLSVLAALVVVALAASLRVLGRAGALTGFVVSAVFVISNGLPGDAGDSLARGAQFLIGGAAAVLWMALAGLGEPSAVDRSASLRWPDLASVPARLSRDDTLRGHAVQLAVTVAAATALYRAVGLDFGYWIPLTALAVLQPDPHTSRVRLIQRASGTLLGCGVVVVAIAASLSDALLIGAVAVTAFALFGLRERSYHWLVTLLTPTALLMISTVDFEGDTIVAERLVDTAIGLVLALAVLVAVRRWTGWRARA